MYVVMLTLYANANVLLLLLSAVALVLTVAEIRASSNGSIVGNNFNISLSANVEGEFQCSLDGASFQSCILY